MVRRILILLIALAIPFLHAANQEETRYVEGPIPSWVTPCEFSLEPIPLKPSQTKFQLLLSDYQYNWEEKTSFIHAAFKVLNRAGIQDHSELGWTFVPSYQHLIVHQIRVYRDGQWVDRLGTSRHQLIQRENELEQKIYDGHLTLVYFLDDIRVGDIIEYAYSSVGENPIISLHLATSMGFQKEYIMEKVYRRLLVHPASECKIKAFNTSLEPCINDFSPNLREYVWETTEAAACSWEKHMPDWYSGIARALISEYKTWGELAKNNASLYSLSQISLIIHQRRCWLS